MCNHTLLCLQLGLRLLVGISTLHYDYFLEGVESKLHGQTQPPLPILQLPSSTNVVPSISADVVRVEVVAAVTAEQGCLPLCTPNQSF